MEQARKLTKHSSPSSHLSPALASLPYFEESVGHHDPAMIYAAGSNLLSPHRRLPRSFEAKLIFSESYVIFVDYRANLGELNNLGHIATYSSWKVVADLCHVRLHVVPTTTEALLLGHRCFGTQLCLICYFPATNTLFHLTLESATTLHPFRATIARHK